jgi:RNA polymerase sigma-70 factor, ECF subfamily
MVLSDSVLPRASMDVDLVRRARSGDRAAQEKLAKRHRQPMYVLALQLMGNRDDALDVVQDALLRFFTTLHRFDLRRPVKPWLYQIVRNRAMDLHRRRKVRRHESLDAVDEDGRQVVELCDASVDLEGDVAHSQLKARIWRALKELSPRQREILVLRDYQDLSYTEIAATLNIPIGTVMSRLHGARKRLRAVLKDDLQTLLH